MFDKMVFDPSLQIWTFNLPSVELFISAISEEILAILRIELSMSVGGLMLSMLDWQLEILELKSWSGP